MKQTLIPVLTLLMIGCGGSKYSPQGGNGNTELSGSWNITVSGDAAGTLQAKLISIPPTNEPNQGDCSVQSPIGGFAFDGPACFLADDVSEEGSISGTLNGNGGPWSAQAVLAATNTDPAFPSQAVYVIFVDTNAAGEALVSKGSATINAGTLTGVWTCISGACSGTFTATHN